MNSDPISRDIFQHELISVAEEMSVALRRAAFSSIIWDMLDYSCGLMLPNGDMIAQAQTIPSQLGIMPTAVKHVLAAIPIDQWHEGDVIICNDPYRGCTHTPDIVLFSPVFLEGTLIAISSTIAHHIDMGGKVPGTEASDSTEIFEEGLIFPPIKLIEQHRPNQAVFDILANNVRDPRASRGDLRAQIAGCRTGERRAHELCRRYGIERFGAYAQACLDYAETYLRRSLETLGNCQGHAVVLMEDDVASDEPMRVEVTVTVRDGRLSFDFTGTSPQRANGLNCPAASTTSMVNYAVKAVLAPDLPHNEGCNRPIAVKVPQGSLLAPNHPAAVSVRHMTQQAIADSVIKALAPLSPKTASACAHLSFPTFTAGGVDDRPLQARGGKQPYFLICDIIGGGMGGFEGGDGLDAVDTHGGYCALLSAEVMETMSPFRIWRTELVPNSGGPGKYRGGLAMLRDYEVLASDVTLSGYLQQTKAETAPWGFAGGGSGAVAKAMLAPGGNAERLLGSKFVALRMKKGERLRLVSAGGGGWGNSQDRPAELIEHDRVEGYVS